MAERRHGPAAMCLALWLPACALAAWHLAGDVPPARWGVTLLRPDPGDMGGIVAVTATLPRWAMATGAGAALGLAGALLQRVLRNPLASPDTLGIAPAAQLGLAVATLYAPASIAAVGREAVAGGAGLLAVGSVLAITGRSGFAAAAVVLAGLAVGLYAGSLGTALALLHGRQLAGLFLWAGGALAQEGWAAPARMAAALAAGVAATALLARPLRMLALPDEAARAAGAPVAAIRLGALVVAVGLSGAVSSLVGTVGFVGLAAPLLVRLTGGGRRTLVWSPVAGAGLLWLVDGLVQTATAGWAEPPPTGAVTALLGAPLLLWALRRLPAGPVLALPVTRRGSPRPVLAIAVGVLVIMALCALLVSPGPGPGHGPDSLALALRWPRVASAAIGGAAAGLAGLLLQRILGNPAASPDVLGLGTGTMLGLSAALLLGLDAGWMHLLAGALGAGAVLALLLLQGRGGAAPERMLLAGVALSAAFGALLALFLATGDPRGEAVLAALSGSTYGMEGAPVARAALVLAVLAAAAWPARRTLEVLGLGDTVARALGAGPEGARMLLMVLVAALTGLATLLAGPLSFVGLMAPHLARGAGLARAGGQMAGSALAGAVVMMAADWAGRTVLFPAELPAGLLAGVLGVPVLLAALARRTR